MADLVTSRIFVDGEKGITAAKLNDIIASSVIQPAFYTSKPTAGTADPTDIALILKAGAYAQVPVSTLGGSATQAQIWSTRLRSYNSVSNPNFEVDQRNVGNPIASPTSGQFALDRWVISKAGTMVIAASQIPATAVVVPGTNFKITSKYFNAQLTTLQASLGTGDNWSIYQLVEGSAARELFGDVSSLSLLVASSVAGLKFSVTVRDNPATQSLTTLCTIASAGWNLIQIPNIPAFPSGNFSVNPGAVGYQIIICLCAGSNLIAPAAGTWQAGSYQGATGMDNFASKPVNSTFSVAFVQHEPGAVCSTLMDKPFVQNLDECLRYYQKSYLQGTVPGSVAGPGSLNWMQPGVSQASCVLSIPFKKVMAKAPTIMGYSSATGATSSVRDVGATTDRTVSVYVAVGDAGFGGFTLATAPLATATMQAQYTADTGW